MLSVILSRERRSATGATVSLRKARLQSTAGCSGLPFARSPSLHWRILLNLHCARLNFLFKLFYRWSRDGGAVEENYQLEKMISLILMLGLCYGSSSDIDLSHLVSPYLLEIKRSQTLLYITNLISLTHVLQISSRPFQCSPLVSKKLS